MASQKTRLRNKADTLASKYYRQRTPFCEMAGLDNYECKGIPNWCHIVTRANMAIRYEEYNHLVMCAGHHLKYTHAPLDWIRKLEEHFPERLATVEANRHNYVKVNEGYYKDWIDHFKELYEEN